jgi:magnesium-transporting ATPase (P-type)
VFINVLLIQNFYQLATNSYVFGATFTLLLSVAYLWQLYNSNDTHSIYTDPVFWISLAYVFYCAVSIPYLGMLNDLWDKYPLFTKRYYFIMYYGAIIINRIFLTIAFLCIRPTMKSN